MKLESLLLLPQKGDPPGIQTSDAQKLPLDIIGHHGNPFLIDLSKPDNKFIPEETHGLTLPIESKSFEERISCEEIQSIDPSQDNFNVGCNRYPDNGNGEKAMQIEVPHIAPAAEVDINFYADKVVSPSETDDCKDGSCYLVKDICVDEGLHSLERVPTQNQGMNKNISFDCKHAAIDEDCVLAKEMTKRKHDLKSRPAVGDCISVFDKDATEELLPGKFSEAIDEPFSIDKTVDGVSPNPVKSSSFERINVLNKSPDREKVDQGEKGNISTEVVPSIDDKLIQSNGSRGSTANNEVESGVITFNFDSAEAAVSDRLENKDNKASQQPMRALYNNLVEDTSSDAATASGRTLFVHHNREDSGFSLSEPIVSSGRVPFSGSISHRSDSSTTSARSFAFPILQSEWNSSPVKMAKADRRRLRKHRWFSCCRF
ncbi:hypothetical protein J5N97_026466 [Dioscorea zingiberensis]|uniref:18S pre-ribosomal assembly protein gar2-like protein n=1 Tax=Dioscorea zingiberensis TaxID=325984 RepID=A0A9D5H6Q3_9LILI|nr:hypothetical protein J5N97_026466 [Dioscorea zingiberensis]